MLVREAGTERTRPFRRAYFVISLPVMSEGLKDKFHNVLGTVKDKARLSKIHVSGKVR